MRPRICERAAAFASTGALLVLSACAVNPISGKHQMVLSSQAQEAEVGAQEAKRVVDNMGLVDDAGLVDYVETVGKRLVAAFSDGDTTYTFHVVDMAEPNAFALPGGFIYVSRGLLVLVNSEDELATVLAHEIGHVAARHASRRLTVAAPFAVVTGITSFATGLVSPLLGNVVAGVGGLTTSLVVAPYSRDQEREADSLGMQLAARSGWDPAALSAVLHSMERDEQLRGSQGPRFSFLASHPSTPERVRNTAEEAAALKVAAHDPVAPDRAAVLRKLDGLVVGADPAGGVVSGERFLHPELDLVIDFPTGWKVLNDRQLVAAIAPKEDAVVVMSAVGTSADLPKIVSEAAKGLGIKPETVEWTTIAGGKAARLQAAGRTENGAAVQVYATFVDHRGTVLEIVGLCALDRAPAYIGSLLKVARSIRRLSSGDWPSIQATRLRLQTAKRGDSVRSIATRSASAWRPEEIAIANGIQVDTPLAEDFVVKVAIKEPYRRD